LSVLALCVNNGGHAMKHIVIIFAIFLSATTLVRGMDDAAKDEKTKKKEKEPTRFWPRGPLIEDVKKDLELSDDQIAKAKAAVAEVEKKNANYNSEKEVADAKEEVKKAKDALKAAEDKLKATEEGFVLLEEEKKALYETFPEDKKEKGAELIHYKVPKDKKKTAKADAPAEK
jgi:membrane-associated HD superfamily phosphohydrolase